MAYCLHAVACVVVVQISMPGLYGSRCLLHVWCSHQLACCCPFMQLQANMCFDYLLHKQGTAKDTAMMYFGCSVGVVFNTYACKLSDNTPCALQATTFHRCLGGLQDVCASQHCCQACTVFAAALDASAAIWPECGLCAVRDQLGSAFSSSCCVRRHTGKPAACSAATHMLMGLHVSYTALASTSTHRRTHTIPPLCGGVLGTCLHACCAT
jgi:hypothetical protein